MCDRFDTLSEWLAAHPSTTYEQAMSLLGAVSVAEPGCGTEWSCVYHLNDFSVDIVVNHQYDNVYSFTRKDFH